MGVSELGDRWVCFGGTADTEDKGPGTGSQEGSDGLSFPHKKQRARNSSEE